MIREEIKARMREVVAQYPEARSAMLPCLHLVQDEQGYVTAEGIAAVAEAIGAKVDEVESVVTFYSMYHQEPLGQQVIHVCTSISCYLCGCDDLMARLEKRLDLKRGETTPDGRFTLKGVECLAACGMAPVLQVNGDFVENVTPERADLLLRRLERGEGPGDLVSRWRPMGNGGYTAADGLAGDGSAPGATGRAASQDGRDGSGESERAGGAGTTRRDTSPRDTKRKGAK
jgi:NADH-quinone oxidoreductase E subunit